MKQLDSKALRNAFGSYMTGVTVITAMTDDGKPVGFTANSFTSVSLEPPLLLVCPAKSLSSFDVFANCEHFAVNILSEDQQNISNIFAGSKDDRFSQIDWHTDEQGNPIIDGALTHFSCKTERNLEAGDHHLLVGQVLDFSAREGRGLGYASGGYFSLGLEREAAEISTQQKQVSVGVIIEHAGKVLLSQSDGKANLPNTITDENTNAVSTIKQFLAENGIEAQLGAVFSIYENTKNNNNYIFYRAFAESSDTKGLGEYVAIDSLAEQNFATPAMATMMNRYATESKNGFYGVYVGQEESGKVH
ncbi:flavin reductase family protein [Psychrobacter sp. ANT_WB68]|uniref:flavin reductase family protein n=1 Tax=Psychrobacter sp. ANT_WB68 TaxID=2597355 RepID=UPI0011F28134|nr:flavin reductase family protein [Psychrobacter sp. ANT_WB68]KAA0914545.1 flavin reductase family protein [Psychrobacter sp. ANT_WB68]